MRDNTLFRERFKRWKKGEQVYQDGRPLPTPIRQPGDMYDYQRAAELGYERDATGHFPTRDYQTGRYLKNPTHPTIMMSVVSDLGEGYYPYYNKKDGLIYSDTWMNLPQYSGGKDGRKVIKWSYNDETGLVRKVLPDIVVTGRRKNVERSYMHPWKTMEEVRREAYEDYQLKRRQTQANLGMSDAQYNLYEKDLSKPLSPVDPVGEFVVSTAALDPAFKYLFSGTGEVLKDVAYKTVGKVKPLRNTLISREMGKAVKSAEPIGRPLIPKNFLTIKPQVRTRVGDVEIDNPELYYHQSASGKANNFINTGRMRTPLEEHWLNEEELGHHIPLKLRAGIEEGYPQDPGSAMFSQGSLWYGLRSDKPDLLVTAKPMPFATKNATPLRENASLSKLEGVGSRRVTLDNIYEQGPHNPENTSAYVWEPDYGYRKVQPEESPVAEWPVGRTAPQITAISQSPQAALDFSDPSGRNIIEEMWYNPVLGKSKAQLLQETTPIDFDPNDMAAALINQNTRNRIGKYLDQIVDKPTPQEVIDIFNNSVLPRLLFMRPGYRGGLMYPTVKSKVDHTLSRGYTVYPKELFEKARGNDTTVGLHYPETGHIGIKEGYEDFAGGHEFRHRLDKFLMKTDTESDILEAAYDNDFLKLSSLYDDLKDVRMGPEAVTTNFDARNAAIGKYHAANTDWKLQNKIIDKLSDEKIIEAVEKSNGYGRAYIDYLRKNNKLTPTKIHQFREAMKLVGMFAGAAPLLNPPKQK